MPDRFKAQEMCIDAVIHYAWVLKYVPDYLKTQEMCIDAFEEEGSLILEYILDYFMTEDMIKKL